MLIDSFNRIHDYLRISLTDKCNLRCQYCMPENARFLPNENLLTYHEIIEIAKIFVTGFGIRKIRFTGGEPLAYPNISIIIQEISKLGTDLAITTNGSLLNNFFPLFKESGLASLNISLDSLLPEKYLAITKRNFFDTVKYNVDLAIKKGFHVKINMVVMRYINDDEIVNFAKWTINEPIHIRFIEFMPFIGNEWHSEKVIPFVEMKERIENIFSLEKLIDKSNSTAKSYRIKNAEGTIAFISTVSNPFCNDCNRLRLSADGELRNCLFQKDGVDLLHAVRNGLNVEDLIQSNIKLKAKQRGGISLSEKNIGKMFAIGG